MRAPYKSTRTSDPAQVKELRVFKGIEERA